jgi:putative pyruvate formate lyase activating enzyme
MGHAVDPAPAYLALHRSGELARRAIALRRRMMACDLCARGCGVNRAEQPGECGIGWRARVTSYHPHFGEEAVLRGRRGSGTIFFSGCSLHCVFCQNYDISQIPAGGEVSAAELASIMLQLQARGCHNINLVSPSHVAADIVEALDLAAGDGLCLPLVYNTGGFDCLTTLALLDGVVDIYMPDMKYSNPVLAERLSGACDYPRRNRQAVRAMHSQVGDLILNDQGVAVRGLLVRHLVLPGGWAGTGDIMRFLATEVSPLTAVNLMDQYRPMYRAREHAPLDRPLWAREFTDAESAARAAGLLRLDLARG